MKKDIRNYVKGCEACQKAKANREKRAAPLNPNPIPEYNWEFVSVDLITHLPESHGYNAILVIVDLKSKDFVAIPTTDSITSEGWANLYVKHIYSKYRLSKRIFSDRGPQFVSSFIRDVYKKLGLSGNPSTAYHPQTDGQTERMNQELETYLRIYISHRQDDWSEWLHLAEFAYRNRVHSATCRDLESSDREEQT